MASSFYGSRSKRRRLLAEDDIVTIMHTSNSITNGNDLEDFDLSEVDDTEEHDDRLRGAESDQDTTFDSSHHSGMYTFEGVDSDCINSNSSTPRGSASLGNTSRSIGGLVESTPNRVSGAVRGQINCSSHRNIGDILEQQNQLNLKLLDKQDKLESSMLEIKSELKDTKGNVEKIMENNHKESEPSVRQKRKYPSSLTEKLAQLHASSEKKFDPNISSSDTYNVEVKEFLRSEIVASYSEYSESQVKLAIQRLYESQRRAVINSRPENVERTQESDLKKKYRARRERLYARRTKYVPAKLREKWEVLNLHYMSEEEDTEDGLISVKKLPWRSNKLSQLMEKLDDYALKSAENSKTFVPERIKRIISADPSTQLPPSDAPDWALKPQFRKDAGITDKENTNRY